MKFKIGETIRFGVEKLEATVLKQETCGSDCCLKREAIVVLVLKGDNQFPAFTVWRLCGTYCETSVVICNCDVTSRHWRRGEGKKEDISPE